MKNNQEWDYKEIRTSEHDALVLFLMDSKNLIKIFKKENRKKLEIVNIQTEVPVMAGYNRNFIVGYIDISFEVREIGYDPLKSMFSEKVYVEVKPRVVNFGSLIRQIKKYREYVMEGVWIVYTKQCSDNIVEALSSQKVEVIKHFGNKI